MTLKQAFIVLTLLIVFTTCSAQAVIDYTKVLSEYVGQPESVFSYSLIATIPTQVATVYVLNVTTLTYLTPGEVGIRSTWFNYATISVPFSLDKTKNQAIVYITDGVNTEPFSVDPIIPSVSYLTKSIAVGVYNIPNQPITYNSDASHVSRMEDDIFLIAFGWKRFLNDTSQTHYVLQLPMVKSSKLVLDAFVDFAQKSLSQTISEFTVIGASKRGWVAWLLAGLDKRIKSVITLVIPVFETTKIFERSFNNICEWPFAMGKYVSQGVLNDIFSTSFEKLSQIVDPKYYSRLAEIPKFQVLGMGDEFFSFEDIKGDKYVRYIPNFGHDLAQSDAMNVILTYQVARMNNITLPQYHFPILTVQKV